MALLLHLLYLKKIMPSPLWFILSFLCVVLEVSTGAGGLYFIFFASGSFITAVLVGAGILFEPWLQWVFFSGLSLLSLIVFRRRLLAFFSPKEGMVDRDSLKGTRAKVKSTLIDVNSLGEIELRGTQWRARLQGTKSVVRGDEVVVVDRDGLTLIIESSGERSNDGL
jgi:membrane protein implicated in regulation of membrane protease activity